VDAPQVVVVRKVVYQHRRVASSTPRPSWKATAMTMHISTYKSQGLLRYAYANSTYTAAACDASAAVQVLRTTPASARSCFPRRRYVCVLPSEDRGEARRVSPWGRAGQGQSPSRRPPPSSVQSLRHTRAPQRRSFGAPFTHRAQDVVSIGADSRQCVQAAPCPAAPSPSKPLASAADGVRPPVRPPAADSARSAAPPQRWTTGTRTTATWRAQT
jgi:hypothetical protein